MLCRLTLYRMVIAFLAAISLTSVTTMAAACSIPIDSTCAPTNSGCKGGKDFNECSSICGSTCAAVEPSSPQSALEFRQGHSTAGNVPVLILSREGGPEPPPPRA